MNNADTTLNVMTISAKHYEDRVAAFPDSIFYKYSNKIEALESYVLKDANPRFNSDELFIFAVQDLGFVVQTTGSLVKAAK